MNQSENNQIEATIIPKKMMFENAQDDFRIYSCTVKDSEVPIEAHPRWGNISVTGNMSKLIIGEEYKVSIEEAENSKFPFSYTLSGMTFEFPKDTASQRKYMEAIVHESKVNAIYDYYNKGEDVIKLIQDGSFNYEAIKGFGEKTYQKLKDDVDSRADSKALTSLLGQYGVSLKVINAVFRHFNRNDGLAVDKIRDNPYVLVDIYRIGFKKADFVALKMGCSRTGAERINNAFKHVLRDTTGEGDTWILEKDLITKASGLMAINKKYAEEEILTENYRTMGIENIDGKFALLSNYNNEKSISEAIINSNENYISYFTEDEITEFLKTHEEKSGMKLEEKQREFFYNWNKGSISFLVGGAGMGKTALMNILVQMLESKNIHTLLMAPTGKSSKVLAEYTDRDASTIHRALGLGRPVEYMPDGEELIEKLEVEHIIIDEISMADVGLVSELFKRVDFSKTKILFVGDDYQLPSVGVGNFLYDCINSGVANVTRLRKVFRQDEGGILDIATKVREGKNFLVGANDGQNEFGKDCIVDLTNQASVPFAVDYYYEQFIEAGLLPEEIMVLSPTRIGKVGTVSLNNRIQEVIEPDRIASKNSLFVEYDENSNALFNEGDLIINTVNSYNRDKFEELLDSMTEVGEANLFNGDTGKIIRIDGNNVYAEFDDIIMKFSSLEMRNMMLHSYSITIHRSQGSASKAVILVLDKSATFQLNANLIYTGVTRARENLIIIGQSNAIVNGGRKFVNMKRKSFLGDMLTGKI